MTNGLVGLLFGLIIGIYFTASYPETVIYGFHKIHVPLMGTPDEAPNAVEPRS